MNKTLVVTILAFGVTACKTSRPEEKKTPSLEKIILNEKLEDSGKFWGTTLTFSSPKAYVFTYGSEGTYWHNTGEYFVEPDRIRFKAIVCADHEDKKAPKIPCDETFGDGYCAIDESVQDIEIALFLRCKSPNPKSFGFAKNGIRFPLNSTKRPIGSIVKIEGKDVRYLGRKKGTVIETVNIRVKPSIDSPKNPYFPTDERNGEFLDAVPKGTKISILGKTVEKDKVKNWQNHWYITEVGHNDRAWLFGEFVQELEP